MMNARFIALLVLVGAASAVASEDANCDVPGFFESYCQHGGVCRDNGVTYADPTNCLCPTPSIGTACSYIVRECRDSPCINGGSCRNQPSGAGKCFTDNNYDCFRCSCPPGWGYPLGWPSLWVNNNKGGICDTPRPVVGCDAFPCQNGGTCVDDPSTVSRYSCTCTGTGWVGQNCTFNCTLGGVCQNGGTCDRGNCLCTSQYTGYDCSSPRFCTTSPCMNGASCSNALGGSCTCAPGWSGKYCSVPSFCSSNPCSAGGTCRDDLSDPAGGQGACQCLSGYNSGWIAGNFIDYGIKNCSTMNFCGASPCQNAATCVQNPSNNDGTCSCREGFAGKYCEVNLANLKACYNKINGKQCFDHGSCGCTDQASCKANDWNVRCECEDQTSSNTGLGYADCRCNSTYVPRCPTATSAAGDYPCQNGGTCVEHAAGMACQCRTGFYGSRCESYHNPCGSSPCQNGGQCSIITETGGYANQLKDTYWTYRCQCKYPYYGRECQNKIEDPANVCVNTVPAPVCQNGGSCVPRPYNFNYYPASSLGGGGFFTDFRVGGRNGLTVRKELPPWMCKCVAGYTGEQCEFSGGYNPQIFTCGVNWPPITTTAGAFTCANGGTCINTNTGPKCACRCGFSGEYCEVIANGLDSAVAETYMDNYGVKMDFCKTNICQNGGSCVTTADWQNAFCQCAPGFFGYYCQYQGLASGANVLPSAIVVAAAAVVAAALRM